MYFPGPVQSRQGRSLFVNQRLLRMPRTRRSEYPFYKFHESPFPSRIYIPTGIEIPPRDMNRPLGLAACLPQKGCYDCRWFGIYSYRKPEEPSKQDMHEIQRFFRVSSFVIYWPLSERVRYPVLSPCDGDGGVPGICTLPEYHRISWFTLHVKCAGRPSKSSCSQYLTDPTSMDTVILRRRSFNIIHVDFPLRADSPAGDKGRISYLRIHMHLEHNPVHIYL